jgi:hypothetical protein
MTEKLEKLISLAITDGLITDKERDVLIKNAIQEGVDLDEFEMYFEAKLYERQQELKELTAAQIIPPPIIEKPKSNKEGDLKKCPSCGSPTESFATKCSDCGHEFRNIDSSNSIKELFQKMNEIQSKKSEETDTIKGMFMNSLSGDKTTALKRELLKSFPIPNTREDILEFLALAIPNCKKPSFWKRGASWESMERYEMAPIWQSKCEQIIIKARFSMKNDPKTLQDIEYYAKELKIK